MRALFVFAILISIAGILKADEQVVVFENSNGTVSILYPASDSGLSLAQIISKDIPQGSRRKVIFASQVPTNRSRRNEWTFNPARDNGIVVP